MPAPGPITTVSELEAATAFDEITFTVRVELFTTGATVHAVPLIETFNAAIELGSVVPEGKTTVTVSPSTSAPCAPVIVVIVYDAVAEAVSGEGVTVAVANVSLEGAVIVYFADVTCVAFTPMRAVRV